MKTQSERAALDLVRGTAAILIVLYHLGRWFSKPLVLNSGLAVDLFFCLSGYVMMVAYDGRLKSDMTRLQFFAARIARLMPLVILGTMMSAGYAVILMYIRGGNASLHDIAASTLLGSLNLPSFHSPLNRGDDQIFPLNGPQYSLFFELFINLVWGYFGWTRKCIPAVCLSVICFGLTITLGVLGGDISPNFLSGFPRVGASFFCGVALFHVGKKFNNLPNLGPLFIACGLLTLFLFCFPSALPFPVQIAWVAVISPILVLSGSRTELRGSPRNIALYLGKLSYPVYILHYPIFCWLNGTFQIITAEQDIVLEGLLFMLAIIAISHLAASILDRSSQLRKSRAVVF